MVKDKKRIKAKKVVSRVHERIAFIKTRFYSSRIKKDNK